jgi:predicted flap endonuclease-1-like 5' DNA nuclease
VEREANTGTEAAVKGTDAADIDADTETAADIDADTETEADTVDVEDAEGGSADTEAVDVIKGIGPAYAERLANEGVHSVADLAAADVSELAEAVDLSETRVGRWVERAQER